MSPLAFFFVKRLVFAKATVYRRILLSKTIPRKQCSVCSQIAILAYEDAVKLGHVGCGLFGGVGGAYSTFFWTPSYSKVSLGEEDDLLKTSSWEVFSKSLSLQPERIFHILRPPFFYLFEKLKNHTMGSKLFLPRCLLAPERLLPWGVLCVLCRVDGGVFCVSPRAPCHH